MFCFLETVELSYLAKTNQFIRFCSFYISTIFIIILGMAISQREFKTQECLNLTLSDLEISLVSGLV